MLAAKQAGWLFIALISLACSGWYFASTTSLIKLDPITLSTTTDMRIYDLIVQQYDVDGHLLHALETPMMRHIPSNDTHWFRTPHITVAQKNAPPWEIHAEEASAIHGGQEITFNRHVVIHQNTAPHTEESTLTTDSLTYYPKEKLAMTLLDILYERPGNRIQSTGMKAYLDEKRVQLLSQARGSYVPNRG